MASKGWPNEASYVAGKFRQVVDDLATGENRIIDRLRNVYVPSLMVMKDNDFPDQLVEDWRQIRARLTAAGPVCRNGEVVRGSVDHTLDGMSEEDAVDLAKDLVALAREYQRAAAQVSRRP